MGRLGAATASHPRDENGLKPLVLLPPLPLSWPDQCAPPHLFMGCWTNALPLSPAPSPPCLPFCLLWTLCVSLFLRVASWNTVSMRAGLVSASGEQGDPESGPPTWQH